MFKHLLVPLDGSRAAEAAVAAAAYFAHRNGARVTLLHLVEAKAPATIHGEPHLRSAADADAYLQSVAARYFKRSDAVAIHVHDVAGRNVVRGILDHLDELGPDAVVMSRHGRAGWRRFLFGNIAQRVIARSTTPVLVVRSRRGEPASGPGFQCRRVLIPHDRSAAHAAALPAGVELARICGAKVCLLQVVPTRGALRGAQSAAGGLLPGLTDTLLELEHRAEAGHLGQHARELDTAGVSVKVEVLRGDPARLIARSCRSFEADVIVMATHGRAGTRAFWAGSIASRVGARTDAALLLIPLKTETG